MRWDSSPLRGNLDTVVDVDDADLVAFVVGVLRPPLVAADWVLLLFLPLLEPSGSL